MKTFRAIAICQSAPDAKILVTKSASSPELAESLAKSLREQVRHMITIGVAFELENIVWFKSLEGNPNPNLELLKQAFGKKISLLLDC